MSKTTLLIVVAAVALYFLVIRKPGAAGPLGLFGSPPPVPQRPRTTPPVPPTSPSLFDKLASAAAGALPGLLSGLGKSPASTASVPGSPSPSSAAWDNVSSSELDQLAAGDAAMGVEGPF